MCNGRAAVIDLSTGEATEQELSEDLLLRGAAIELADSLASEHEGSLVLGTGLLTGSLIPAACAGLVRSEKGVVPLLGSAGVELKLSGFDFLVVKGAAPSPGYIWVRDGIAEFVPAPGIESMDAWARTDRIRSDQGDRRVQLVSAGPWGDAARPASSLVANHWLGEDDAFLGAEFGRRGLAAVAFRGMGELEVADPEAHMSSSLMMRADHASRLGASRGLASYWDGADDPAFASLLHRTVSCFGCPHPCRSFLKVNEAPGQMALAKKEPGYLHYDIPALRAASASGFSAEDLTRAFMECSKAGADAFSLISSGADSLRSVMDALAGGVDVAAADRRSVPGSFSSSPVFKECLTLGLCPRYWAKVGLDMAAIRGCAESAVGRSVS